MPVTRELSLPFCRPRPARASEPRRAQSYTRLRPEKPRHLKLWWRIYNLGSVDIESKSPAISASYACRLSPLCRVSRHLRIPRKARTQFDLSHPAAPISRLKTCIRGNGESRMTYATVMVSLALDQSNEARLEAAGQIAERFDAGIVGIAASQFSPPLYFTSGELAQDSDRRGTGLDQKAHRGTGGAISRGDQEPGRAGRMALRHRLSGTLYPAGSALRRHHRQRWRPAARFRTRWRWPARKIS